MSPCARERFGPLVESDALPLRPGVPPEGKADPVVNSMRFRQTREGDFLP